MANLNLASLVQSLAPNLLGQVIKGITEPQGVPGLVKPGNIDLGKRKVLNNPDGSISTESSMSIGTDEGEVLIPTVVNGKRLSEEEAIKYYEKTGEHLGIFNSVEAANRFAESLHNRQGERYKNK